MEAQEDSLGMPGLEDPERAVAAQARLERLQRTCGGLLKPEARFTDLSDAHMGAAQQTLYDLTGTDALRAPPQCAAQHTIVYVSLPYLRSFRYA